MTPTATAAAPAAPAARPEPVPAVLERLRATFRAGRTRPLAWRVEQLQRLRTLLREREAEAMAALRADLGKPALEAYGGEIGFVVAEIDHTLAHLHAWARPEKVSTPLANQPACSTIIREPLGVVLIIGPWNYPLQLTLGPLVAALAAGNCAVVKPSEVASHTSALVARWLSDLAPDAVAVVEGGVPETTALLEQRFDHIFFTGSTQVGRVVMQAAAKHLTPVTLELGGKSPCIVDQKVDLSVAARRILWGKFWNAGQTCVAPDYVIVHEAVAGRLVERLRATLTEFYGPDPKASPDYARIINERHHRRLVGMLGQGGQVVVGGEHDEAARYIAPTIVQDPPLDAALMTEEIFGPILPVVTLRGLREAIELVNSRPKPLALYVFSSDRAAQEQVLAETSSGGACVNDTVAHLSVPDLPFGGVGDSGMGAYHGRAGFETFSHRKSVLNKSTWMDVKLRYPPYGDNIKWVRRLIG
ncbi:MAG: aldehyde dehydrogenase family protein [Planctomycetes bacterium]|nr:aldehyde dehydrogenase family protein [Planctomycetota bacterium]